MYFVSNADNPVSIFLPDRESKRDSDTGDRLLYSSEYNIHLIFEHLTRVRKSKNFPDSKIFHAKTFRMKRVNRETLAFATKVRKTREIHVFWQICIISNWMESDLFGDFLDYPESFYTIRTVS